MHHSTINRFPGYRFYSDGHIESAWQPAGMGHGMKIGGDWKSLKPSWRGGYLCVRLSMGNGDCARVFLHVVIAEAFLGPKPEGLDCCHNDGIRANCCIENLRYDTKKGNCADKTKHGTMYGGERHHDAKLDTASVLQIRASYGKESVPVIAKRHGISVRNAWAVIRRETWKHL